MHGCRRLLLPRRAHRSWRLATERRPCRPPPTSGILAAVTPFPDPPPPPGSPVLSAVEGRVLACLAEKAFSTPDVYPLSLNALVAGCNQRNNRNPIMALGPREVEAALDSLRHRRLVVLVSAAEGRVPRFRHCLDSAFPIDPPAIAVLTELLLRGPQTVAELRAHADRLHPLPDLDMVEGLLVAMASPDGGLLARLLPRLPGRKESRWAQCLAEAPDGPEVASEPLTAVLSLPPEVESRLSSLEREVSSLRAELSALRHSLGES